MLQRPSRGYALLLTALLALLTTTGPAWAAEVVVTQEDPNGWFAGTTHLDENTPSTASVALVYGPKKPPCGVGSVQLSVGEDGNSAAAMETVNYNGLALDQLRELRYSTFVPVGSQPGIAPFMLLDVDLDESAPLDHDQLVFDPALQGPGLVKQGVWQTWNAGAGLWYSFNEDRLLTLAEYLEEHPSATLSFAGTDEIGALWIAAGFGGSAWSNFVGYVDCVTVGFAGEETTTYDFETSTVKVGNRDSGVRDRVISRDGRTLQEAVNECADGVRNHGHFVSCVVRLANNLQRSGVINARESNALKLAAARSNVGKKKK